MQNTVVVVIGRKGSGKSTLVREIVAERSHVLIIDSLAEYGPECGAEPVEGIERCADRVVDVVESGRRFKLSLRCLAVDDNLDLCELAYGAADDHPGLLLVVEETSLYVSPTQLPDEIAQLVRYGRHRELDLVFVARRPSELHRDLTANADILVTFQTQEPRDLVYLRTFYGDEALRLPSLPPYHVKVFGEMAKAPHAVLARLASQGD